MHMFELMGALCSLQAFNGCCAEMVSLLQSLFLSMRVGIAASCKLYLTLWALPVACVRM